MKKYHCKWCSNDFEKDAYYHQGSNLGKDGFVHATKKGCYSNQIKCPKCGNFVPTWEVQKIDSVVGRKHVHIRSV